MLFLATGMTVLITKTGMDVSISATQARSSMVAATLMDLRTPVLPAALAGLMILIAIVMGCRRRTETKAS